MSAQPVSRTAVVALTLLACGAWTLGCDSCPDLYHHAFEFDIQGADASLIIMTTTDSTGATPCDAVALSENCQPPAGMYDLSFEWSGAHIGDLTGVCTQGSLTGCEAEDADAKGPPPLIQVLRDGSGWHITLERQGVCP